jgi:hypothetical protein
METLDYRAVYHDARVDPALPGFQGPCIYLFWHEYIPFPLYLRGHCDVSMLLSQHRDAEWLSHAARLSGFDIVRGSTTRGGVTAIRQLIERARGRNLAITPDGPKGPRRQLAPGCVYLSSKLQIPLVLIGFGYDTPWRNRRAWDQFAVPRPGTRARAIFSPPIQIPTGLDRQQLETYRQWTQRVLNQLTDEAEQWATQRNDRLGATPLRRSPIYR